MPWPAGAEPRGDWRGIPAAGPHRLFTGSPGRMRRRVWRRIRHIALWVCQWCPPGPIGSNCAALPQAVRRHLS
ncbi:hypothetical protein LA76x_0105 [Lysobacter antibioticus]|uniref:Uncharacterized protein n=1 Tax=Lysobacter antibioticus TaxID=84531 RepID=A0A0S2F421_LYSAN|nr:hypothetical protein LA76x_0105 [Lysobacter antibioticus]